MRQIKADSPRLLSVRIRPIRPIRFLSIIEMKSYSLQWRGREGLFCRLRERDSYFRFCSRLYILSLPGAKPANFCQIAAILHIAPLTTTVATGVEKQPAAIFAATFP